MYQHTRKNVSSHRETLKRKYRKHLLIGFLILFGFLMQPVADGFPDNHWGFLSSHGMAIAVNSFDDNTIHMRHGKFLKNEKIQSMSYNRFSFFPFWTIKQVVKLAQGVFKNEIYYARLLMILYYSISLFILYIIVYSEGFDAYRAAFVLILASSTYFFRMYDDMIFVDIPTLAGMSLAGLSIFYSRKGNTNSVVLILMSIVSSLLVWVGVFVYLVYGLQELSQVLLKKNTYTKEYSYFFRSIGLLFFSGLTVAVILLIQFYFEWKQWNRELTQMPSFNSMMFRLGAQDQSAYEQFSSYLDWIPFLKLQSGRVVTLIVPFSSWLGKPVLSLFQFFPDNMMLNLFVIFAVSYFVYLGIRKMQHVESRMALEALTFSGVLWVVVMKNHTTFHDFTSIFLAGIPILFYFGVYNYIDNVLRKKERLKIALLFLLLTVSIIDMQRFRRFKLSMVGVSSLVTEEMQSLTKILNRYSGNAPINCQVDLSVDDHVGWHGPAYYLRNCIFVETIQNASFIIQPAEKTMENPEDTVLYKGRHISLYRTVLH